MDKEGEKECFADFETQASWWKPRNLEPPKEALRKRKKGCLGEDAMRGLSLEGKEWMVFQHSSSDTVQTT